ncbi:MAG: DUF898 family protein [Lachnospiraceae bacterium]|nr:DUF898 family protein [Lachnospiraceae bacterium]
MFCWNCGNENPDGAAFCANCGAKQESSGVPQMTPKSEESGSSSSSYTGSSSGTSWTGTVDAESGVADAIKSAFKNKDLLKLTEFLAGILCVLPICTFVFTVVISVFGLLSGLPLVLGAFFQILQTVFRVIRMILVILTLVLSIAEICGLVFSLGRRTDNDKQALYIGFIVSALTLVMSILFLRRYSPILVVALRTIFGLAAVIIGMDLLVKVYMDHVGLHGPVDLAGDFQKIKSVINRTREIAAAERETKAAEKTAASGTSSAAVAPVPTAVGPVGQPVAAGDPNASYFDGNGFEVLGLYIIIILLSIVTCTIATPWLLCKWLRWEKSHTVIGGKRLSFNGTGGQLIGHWIKWILLSIITCGIYSFLQVPMVDYQKWVAKHTTYVGCEIPTSDAYPDSFFTGSVAEYLGTAIISGLLTFITCGFGTPWANTMVKKYMLKNTVVHTDRYLYEGTGGGLFGTYIVNILLCGITCGIYTPWAVCSFNRYFVSHTRIQSTGNIPVAS